VSGIENNGIMPSISKQLDMLSSLDFRVVKHNILNIKENASDEKYLKKINEYLSKKLIDRREKSIYNIDGLVVYTDYKYKRCTERNPKYAFSFKENTICQTVVEDVIWKESRTGFLKPKVK